MEGKREDYGGGDAKRRQFLPPTGPKMLNMSTIVGDTFHSTTYRYTSSLILKLTMTHAIILKPIAAVISPGHELLILANMFDVYAYVSTYVCIYIHV